MHIFDKISSNVVRGSCYYNCVDGILEARIDFNKAFQFISELQELLIAAIKQRLGDKVRQVYILPYYGGDKGGNPYRFFLNIEAGDEVLLHSLMADLGIQENLDDSK